MLESMLYQKYRQACTPACHPPLESCPGEGNLPRVSGHPRAEGCGVCSAGRKEMLEEIRPRQMPMESVSTTHRDYRVGDCQFTPLPATHVQAGVSPRSAHCSP